MTSKELEKSIKWLSNVDNFKNVSRYSKEYFEHFNKVVKALEQAQKLSELYKELATLYRDRFDYTNSATEIKRLWGKIKEERK